MPDVAQHQEAGRLRRASDRSARPSPTPTARCRCKPSYRGRRRHPVTGKPIWQKATKNRAEVLTWLADAELAAELAKHPSRTRARASRRSATSGSTASSPA